MKKIILTLTALFLFSCDSGTLWEDEMYAVYWIDDNVSLGIKVDSNTFIGRYTTPLSVGSNENYLVVKEGENFYFSVKAEDSWKNDMNEGIFGPYTQKEFLIHKEKLKLPEFEVEFKD